LFTIILTFLLTGIDFQSIAGAKISPDNTVQQIPAPAYPQIREEFETAPDHLAAFVIVMTESVLGEPETAIDAQLRVEKLLEILKQTGSVSSYQTYLGVNKIRVTGSPQALELLSDWLEVAQLQKYQPDQPWEQPFLAELDISAPAGTGVISGQVIRQDNSDPIYGIEITAYRKTGPTSWVVAGKTNTDAAGNYSLGNLDGGIYVVYFNDPNGNFVSEFYNDKPNFTIATNFTVTDGQTTADIDASMTLAGKIAGRVTKISDGNPATDIVVSAYLSGGSIPYNSSVVSSDGIL
jgi:hypothetical protein